MPRQTQTTKSKASTNARVQPPDAPIAPDLRDFTLEFFGRFGAEVKALDRRKHGPLHVVLPADLAEHFGKPTLGLTFQTVEPGSGHDLVAHGSRMFDRMLAWLDRRAALTVQQLPVRHLGSDGLLSAVRPRNAAISNLRLQEQIQLLIAFTWRITYRADDKREELHTVVVDENGARLSLLDRANPTPEAIDIDALLADAEPLPPVFDENGQPLPPKLPAVAHMVRLAEVARKYAIYHADLRCVAHETEILPRLYRTLNRLTTYYGQQIEEVHESHDLTGEKRLALEVDLARKVAEEVENHRLHVAVDLVSYAVLAMPIANADLSLSNGQREVQVRVQLNRYNGALVLPSCSVCGRATSDVLLCRNGHIHCDDCLRQCATCLDELCASCGVEACPVCGKENCATCGRMCWACGERACAEHISTCPVCGDAVCHACQSACAHCGVRQCRSHLRADCVIDEDVDHGAAQLICNQCAVRCPGCNQYSVHMHQCEASGQRFCANCIVECAHCGKRVGPGFYVSLPGTDLIYCRDCVVECPSCHQPVGEVGSCHSCGAPCCMNCGHTCVVCNDFFCGLHSHVVAGCHHAACSEHAVQCAIGRESVCPSCSRPCPICERHYCTAHSDVCAWCGEEYCAECVRATSGLCDTCATVHRGGEQVAILAEPCAADASVRAIAGNYRWHRASNAAITIYAGTGIMGSAIVIVKPGSDGQLNVQTRKLSILELARGLFMR